MRYAIVEDQEYAQEGLKRIMERLHPEAELVFTSDSVEECIRFFSAASEQLDVVFMDIELADGTCFEIFEKTDVHAPVIFTTSYDQYAIQAYRAYGIDYLLKPVREQDVEASLNTLQDKAALFRDTYVRLHRDISEAARQKERILISRGEYYEYVNISDIAFFRSEDKCVVAYTHDGRELVTGIASLSELEDMLCASDWFRLSRAIVAHISAVTSVSKFFNFRLKVIIRWGDNTREVLISAAKKGEFLAWYGR